MCVQPFRRAPHISRAPAVLAMPVRVLFVACFKYTVYTSRYQVTFSVPFRIMTENNTSGNNAEAL